MNDGVETRELRYFVAVAEELHFGRAAERLGIAQPPLSRAIRALERRLDAPLFDRSTRAVALTEAGAVLLTEGRAALDAVDAAERRTRRAAGARPVLGLVAKAGASQELLAKLLDAYAAEPGAVEVDVTLCGPGEQERVLRDGRADVALLHRPFDATDGYDTEELAEEGQALFLPVGHPLAGRAELRTADLADLPLPRWPRPDGGFSPGEGPQVHDSAQLQQLVMLGRAVAVLPDSVRAGLPEGIVAVPVVDAARVTTLLAWPPQSRVRGLADLVRVASRL
jgi:LysR family transcriptional regulator, benzoate and cis,cis-muconate-responsive activator of ben and cat genes